MPLVLTIRPGRPILVGDRTLTLRLVEHGVRATVDLCPGGTVCLRPGQPYRWGEATLTLVPSPAVGVRARIMIDAPREVRISRTDHPERIAGAGTPGTTTEEERHVRGDDSREAG